MKEFLNWWEDHDNPFISVFFFTTVILLFVAATVVWVALVVHVSTTFFVLPWLYVVYLFFKETGGTNG